jgi:hypothetical protein
MYICILLKCVNLKILEIRYSYLSRFISEGVAETSQIFFRNQNDLAMRNIPDVAGGKSIAV